MNPTRGERQATWNRMNEILERALDVTAGERADWVRLECGDEGELARELLALLEFHDGDDDRLDRPALGAHIQLESTCAPEPESIGPYRILDPIGHGGMGEVYLAERIHGAVTRRVAVKLVRRGVETREARRRFEIEGRALALLDHENTARFLDCGVTEAGQPFLVMEHIEGLPLNEYCHAERLGPRARLRVFLQACQAVEFAHRHLIVHRDLKPANILVRKDGLLKLLDFGIARILPADDEASGETETGTASRCFSPEYASPEQVRGVRASTSSDIYSLGVVLYELLSGHRPYHIDSKSALEIERVVCDTAPPPPSSLVLAPQPGSAQEDSRPLDAVANAARFGLRPDRLRSLLRGDLDNIVAKAMAKDPDARYGSVSQLAEDIHRHLNGHPVLARRPTLLYRTMKFAWRNKTACLVALVVVTAGLVAVLEARRASRAADRSVRALETTAELLPAISLSAREKSIRELRRRVLRAAETADEAIEGDPGTQAKVIEAFARVMLRLELYREAAPWIERLEALTREFHDPGQPEFSERLLLIASHYRSTDRRRAIELIDEALESRRGIHGKDHEQIADALLQRSEANLSLLRIAEASADCDAAVEMRRRVLGESHPDVLVALLHQAMLLTWHTGDREVGRELAEKADRMLGTLGRLDEATELEIRRKLATITQDHGMFERAIRHFEVATELHRRRLPRDHPALAGYLADHAMALKDIANSERAHGRPSEASFDRALALVVEVREILEENPEDHRTLDTRTKIAKVFCDAGQFEAASAELREVLRGFDDDPGKSPTQRAVARTLMGRVLLALGKPSEALTNLERALETQAGIPSYSRWEHSKTLTMTGLARALGRGDLSPEVEAMLIENHAVIETDRGRRHYRTRDSIERIIAFFRAAREGEKAAAWEAELQRFHE